MLVSVVDVGGSHFVYALYDTASGRLSRTLEVRQIEVSGTHPVDPLEALENICRLSRLSAGDELGGMSIAFPSPFDHDAGVSRLKHKLQSLYGIDLRKALERPSGLAPGSILFVNDADAFLRGALTTSGHPRERTIGITLGTGIGSAFAVKGEVLSEGQGIPPQGEIWNLAFVSGTIEDAISTRALVSAYEKQSGSRISVHGMAEAARSGDAHCAQAFADFGARLAAVLDQICEPFGAEQILLGGGICGAADLFLEITRSALRSSAHVSVVKDRAVAPLIGAGAAWDLRHGHPSPLA